MEIFIYRDNNNNFGDNMKITLSFSVEQTLASSFIKVCADKKINKNRIIESALMAVIEKNRKYELIDCNECGARYSSKFENCPVCEANDLAKKQENEAKNREIIEKQHEKDLKHERLFKEQIDLIDQVRNAEYTLNRLRGEEGREEQIKKIENEVTVARKRLEEINIELGV